MNRRHTAARLLLGACALPVLLVACAVNGSITPASQATIRSERPVVSVLMLNTGPGSSPTLLLTRQTQISNALQSQLAATGLAVNVFTIAAMEMNTSTVVSAALRTYRPSHVLQVTVPSAKSRSDSQFMLSHTVRAEMTDIGTRSVVWRYSADVDTGEGAEPADIAGSIMARMRQDKVIR